MKNLRYLPIIYVSCFLVSAVLTANDAAAQSPALDAEQREQQVVERFWTLLEKTPRRGTSLDRVYGYYVDTGRLEELTERCRELTDKTPDNAKAWLLSGLVLSRRNDDAATISALEKAMTLDAADLLAPFYLGETYIAQGRLRDAAETLEKALQRALESIKMNTGDKAVLGKDVLAILQTLGRVYERFGDRQNSTRVWDKLEELFPGDRDILVRIAETLEEESRFDEALKRYQRLAEIAKNDNFARVQYTLAAADIKIRLGSKQGAIDDFEKLLEELASDNWLSRSIRDRVERIFVRQADYAGLAGYYQKRLQKYPNDLDTIRRHAIALVRLSRTDEAKKLLADTLEKAPSDVSLRLALIDLLVADRDFEAVDKHYAKIDEIEPNNPDHISQWGLAVLENTKLEEPERKAAAVKIWSKLITARPDDPAVLIVVADLANTAKITDEAEKLYKKAIELRPNDPGYKEYLGYFYHHRERKEEAVATLRQIAEGNRRTAGNLSQLGGIFKSLGYTEEAMTAMKEAVELAPEEFELRMQYADLLFANEKIEYAETQYLEGEKLAKPLTEEFARFLYAYTKLLQSTGKLRDAAETLAKQLKEPQVKRYSAQLADYAADFWRLAVYQTALGLMNAATESIESAMEKAPNSNILLEAAASIFEKGSDQVRAAAIYEKLANADQQRRVEHLKRLANLRRDLGEMEQAIETARLVMATGAGNAANSRFFADMLLSIGRRKDGIEILRRAVRLDPTDTTTLTTLADVLFDTNEVDEALEIQWRIFEKTEDLQGKIGAVSRMSSYYQQSQRFDKLIERLRQTSTDAASRRESAYCLAQ
ncbi:MAG: tetratricopeptide repeat protein, partial [Planctomycetaceae bacterium]|nr:tetratricopeptide repeat protein [Planctomycetaceae bacterium]